MRTKKLLFLPILIAVLALNAQKPDLVLPVGQFEAIMKVDFSKDGRNILTGSTDGTAQLWDLAGYSLQTFGEKNDGRILWSSFSPDGRGVYTRIGRNGLVRLMGLDGAVLDSFESGTPNAYASLTPDCPCDDPLFNAPHLIVLKSEIALYAFSLNKEVKESESVYNLLSDEDMVSSFIAVTPFCSARTETAGSKQLILIEDYERGGLLLVDEDGQARDSLPIEGVLHPAFSGDGRSMLFESNKLLLWDTPDRQVIGLEGAEVPRRGFADAFSPDGEYFVTPMMDGTAALWNRAGEVVHSFGAQSYGISSATFSPDGAYFLMGFNDGSAKLFNRQYELLRVFDNPANTAEEIAYSATCSPEASNVLLRPSIVIKSRDGTVNSWELEQGQVRLEPSGFPCDTWSDQLELSSTGPLPASTQRSPTFLLEASGTGRVSCKSRETGELLAELIAVGESDWVVTTPSGLFDASPGAMQRLHYTAFYDNTYEVIELEQLKERYYEPGLLQKILGYSNEPIRSVEGFDTIALYPQINLSLDTLSHRLDVKLVLRNGGIGKTSIFINGKEIIPDANPPRGFNRQRDTAFAINLAEYRRYFLQDSLNTISVRAYNEAGWLKSPAHTLAYRPRFARTRGNTGSDVSTPSFQPIRDPALYAIIVGTANYAGDKLDLKFPGKDAAAMAQAIQQAGGQLFEDRVHVRLFTTDTTDRSRHPTRANIKAAFDDFNRQANAEDILLVYLSGHGVTYGDADRAQFYYLTQDISSENLSDEAVRRTRTLSTDTLTKWINDIPAQKQVMILDACNSGKVVEALETGTKNLNSSQIRALDRMKDRTGMYVLAGSAADKVSYEA
ncbi:MAG: caspase family protein, partial [Phaeodactylibacter sp.]|nr:caspase family protein [Phaeodactylibacter sp.]